MGNKKFNFACGRIPVRQTRSGISNFLVFLFIAFNLTGFVLLPSSAFAINGHLNLPVEILSFKSDVEGKTNLELFFKVSNSKLQFIAEEYYFICDTYAEVRLRNLTTEKVVESSMEKKFISDKYSKTLDPYISHIFKFVFKIAPGKYEAHIVLADKQAKKEIHGKQGVTVPDYYDQRLTLSSLQLSLAVPAGGRPIYPKIDRLFGERNHEVDLYFECYNLHPQDDNILTCEYQIMDSNNKSLHSFADNVPVTNGSQGFRNCFSVKNFKPGKYILSIKQTEKSTGNTAVKTKCFSVTQSPTDLRFCDFEDLLGELSLIAKPEELIVLEALDKKDRQNGIDEFWAKKDPTAESEENELMEEFYRRIREAQSRFSLGNIPGWRTDRGMIYVLFGPPDLIEIIDEKKWEPQCIIWHYTRPGLQFSFTRDPYNFKQYNLLNRANVLADYLPR